MSGPNHPMFGKHHSLESRMKMSKSRKGMKGIWLGKKLSNEHKQKLSESHKKYKTEEERRRAKLNANIKYHHKYGSPFNLSSKEYKWALHSWSKTIKSRDNDTCQTCFAPAEVSHQILHK